MLAAITKPARTNVPNYAKSSVNSQSRRALLANEQPTAVPISNRILFEQFARDFFSCSDASDNIIDRILPT